jgi:hypothetical protein
MVSLTQLWLPILAAAIGGFVASSLIHMVLKWHNSDYKRLPNEEEVRAALKPVATAPAMYFIPHMMDHKEIAKPENSRKFEEGPIGMITILAPGKPKMGPNMVKWLLLNIFVAAVAAYLASKTVPAGASFLAVCRPVSIVAFMSFAVGSLSDAIWFGKSGSTVAKDVMDSVIYAVVMACIFAWLWPHA